MEYIICVIIALAMPFFIDLLCKYLYFTRPLRGYFKSIEAREKLRKRTSDIE